MNHELKLQPRFAEDIKEGRKTFEIRRDDRGYKLGDVLTFTDLKGGPYEMASYEVVYKLTHDDFPDGIPAGYCVLGISEQGKEVPSPSPKREAAIISREELKRWLLKNCVDACGDLDLSNLDFSDFEGNVRTCFMKVKKSLYQGGQHVGVFLDQGSQVVEGDLYQAEQRVKGSIEQGWQRAGEQISQDFLFSDRYETDGLPGGVPEELKEAYYEYERREQARKRKAMARRRDLWKIQREIDEKRRKWRGK